MISQGFEVRKGGIPRKNIPKTPHFVSETLKMAQNKAFREKKYLTEGLEWIY